LPEDLKRSFRDELEAYERERQMPYVTSIERMGIEQGIEQGRDTERQTIALTMIQENIPLETIARITGLRIEQLQQLQSLSDKDRSN
jgi:predicted transposase/invertase (TIGR01784 family)